MSRIKTEDLHDYLIRKKEKYGVRVTIHLEGMPVTVFSHGSTKNKFLDDCIKRDWNESRMGAQIMETYYSVLDLYPDLKEKEPNAIKQFIIDKIKLE